MGKIPAIAARSGGPVRARAGAAPDPPDHGDEFLNDAFLPASTSPVAAVLRRATDHRRGNELLALDSTAADLGAGGGATPVRSSRERPGAATATCRPPRGRRWREVVSPPRGRSRPGAVRRHRGGAGHVDRVGRGRAFGERTTPHAREARLGPDGTAEAVTLPASGPGRGGAAKMAFSGPNEGWMATARAGCSTTRTAASGRATPTPRTRARSRSGPTRPPSSSPRHAPTRRLGALRAPAGRARAATCRRRVKRLPPLLRQVRTKLRGTRLVVRFALSRRARVQIIAAARDVPSRARRPACCAQGATSCGCAEPQALAAAARVPRARAAVRAEPVHPRTATACRRAVTATRSRPGRHDRHQRGRVMQVSPGAVARRRAVVVALVVIALAAIVPALASVTPPPAGLHAQP